MTARSIDGACIWFVEYPMDGGDFRGSVHVSGGQHAYVRRERCSLPEGHEGEHIHEPSELRKLGLALCEGCKQPTDSLSLAPARWPDSDARSKALCPACAMRELGV